MKRQLLTILFFTLISAISYSQEKNVLLKGELTSNKVKISDAHIYNVSKKLGTISDDNGSFSIIASELDTLYISSLEYENKYYLITAKNIENKFVPIELISSVNELDEVFLRHLTGDLSFDILNKPKDTIPEVGYTFKRSDLFKKPAENEFEGTSHPNAQAMTDPIGPVGAGIGLPDKRYLKEQRLKRELKQKKDFASLLIKDLGLEYFTDYLKIPKDKIHNFLSYCEYKSIVEKYHSNKQLEVIEILKEESSNFNAIKE